ncbi:MAG: hypothetical protein CM15mP11_09880 [Gammaproteobacteria bacterium]|nr:MAG: hypothetical protein CM15mP11_09880 [Gammaproteobacteria bacterium]
MTSKPLTGCLFFTKINLLTQALSHVVLIVKILKNIINSEGQIRNIEITNASKDGLDIDFSNLTVDNVYVKKRRK